MDLHAWTFLAFPQKIAFLFVFVLLTLGLVRALRVGAWIVRPAPDAIAERRVRTGRRWAGATRGHARAAVWFMAAAGALGLADAYNYLGNSGRPIYFYIIEDSVAVLDAAAVGFAVCAALLAIALGLDVAARRLGRRLPATLEREPAEPRPGRLAAVADVTQRLLGIVALLAIASAFAAFRPDLESGLAKHGERWMASDAFQALGWLWGRCAPIAAALGAFTWLATLVEGLAMARWARRRP